MSRANPGGTGNEGQMSRANPGGTEADRVEMRSQAGALKRRGTGDYTEHGLARPNCWQAEAEAALTKFVRPNGLGNGEKSLHLSEQFMIVITCRDEKHQVELLGRFQGEGLECKALVG